MEGKKNHKMLLASFISVPFTSHFRLNFDRFCHHFRFLFFTLENRNARIVKVSTAEPAKISNLHKFIFWCAAQETNERRKSIKSAFLTLRRS